MRIAFLLALFLLGPFEILAGTPYDTDTVRKLDGKIKRVDTVESQYAGEDGLRFLLDTPSGNYAVDVCPKWYAEQNRFGFKVGEPITVLGSVFKMKDGNGIYAATVERPSSSPPQTLEFREPVTGIPLWYGEKKDIPKGGPMLDGEAMTPEQMMKAMQQRMMQMMQQEMIKNMPAAPAK